MGDSELVSQILEACVPDLNANFKDFVDAVEREEWDQATCRIHAMKGASQNADLTAVALLTLEIEHSLREGQSRLATESVGRLENLVSATIGEVRRYLTN